MKHPRHIFKEIGYSISDFLRRICGGLSPGARLIVIVSMLLIFTAGNLYFTISTIYNWGQENGRKEIPGIQHIDGLDMMSPGIQKNDTINLIDSPVNSGWLDKDSINNIFLINNEKRTRENRSC